ncbi:hypothetical protein E1293_10865 [Actinomadura darangshiensis]|uniref:CobQ/CobB/MinD/ParA nucleotide binding domain-containing protein n=1 Tax=Actinomadura darangshiensis TaxID=705336 RepID=A0A4R5BJ34_9ACTN|nr:hypothetical protein [Actinomadura darangshiensis]TDD85599.1 hypothetical protein E1293_10865 [Actinomadura darangshiensis]
MDHDWIEESTSSERTVLDPPGRPRPSIPLREPDGLVLKDVHGESLLRRLGRGMARPFRAAGDVQALAESGRWVQQPVNTGLRIAVTGVQGGAGKSTVAALLAATFARYRQDRVLALDLDPEFGSLPLRLGVSSGRSLADLRRAGLGTAPFEEIKPYLAQPGERLWAMPGSPGWRGEADHGAAAVYRSAGLPLSRFFGVTVIDCGGGPRTDLHRAVLASAHAQVLVTPGTAMGAAGVSRAFTRLRAGDLRELVQRTLVVFTVQTPQGGLSMDLATARESLRKVGSDAVVLGFDRHLAVGTTVDSARLGHPARVTAVEAAAGAIRRALPSRSSPLEGEGRRLGPDTGGRGKP